MFSRNRAVNLLAAARFFLFGARDVWFTVALPVFLAGVLGWPFWQAGAFMAVWIIGYGFVQAITPALKLKSRNHPRSEPDASTAFRLAVVLAVVPIAIALSLRHGLDPAMTVTGGLVLFGVAFALNSAVHSYLILAFTGDDRASMNVGFYYMANAGGRLAGTILSGWLYQIGAALGATAGIEWCLWASAAFIILAALLTYFLPDDPARL
jgi:MFS family permease